MQISDIEKARKMHKKPWSEDDEIYLEYFVFMKDAPIKEAAAFLGRTEKAVQQRVYKIRKRNTNTEYMNRPWTEKEETFIKQHYNHMTYKNIGQRLNRTELSVRFKVKRLDLGKNKKLCTCDSEIRQLAQKGYYLSQISKQLQFSVAALQNYMDTNNIPYAVIPLSERASSARDRIKKSFYLFYAKKGRKGERNVYK